MKDLVHVDEGNEGTLHVYLDVTLQHIQPTGSHHILVQCIPEFLLEKAMELSCFITAETIVLKLL